MLQITTERPPFAIDDDLHFQVKLVGTKVTDNKRHCFAPKKEKEETTGRWKSHLDEAGSLSQQDRAEA